MRGYQVWHHKRELQLYPGLPSPFDLPKQQTQAGPSRKLFKASPTQKSGAKPYYKQDASVRAGKGKSFACNHPKH